MKKIFEKSITRVIFSILLVILAMCISFAASYTIIRKNAPSSQNEGASGIQNENFAENKPFPNLPVNLGGTYDKSSDFSPDTNDYLVISEGSLVNLYAIDKDENKTFERVLEIDLASLKAEDRELLKKGILLNDKASLLALIEDYSS